MEASELKSACLALPGSYEDFPFGPDASVFKVAAPGGKAKMFALTDLDADELSVSLKCDPALAEQLRAAEITGAYHEQNALERSALRWFAAGRYDPGHD